MTTLVWLFFGMTVVITAFVSSKITSWNIHNKYRKAEKKASKTIK